MRIKYLEGVPPRKYLKKTRFCMKLEYCEADTQEKGI